MFTCKYIVVNNSFNVLTYSVLAVAGGMHERGLGRLAVKSSQKIKYATALLDGRVRPVGIDSICRLP
jgi:hypothetical protein